MRGLLKTAARRIYCRVFILASFVGNLLFTSAGGHAFDEKEDEIPFGLWLNILNDGKI